MNYRECVCWPVIPNLTAGSRKVRNHNDTMTCIQQVQCIFEKVKQSYRQHSTAMVQLFPCKPLSKVWRSTLLSGLRGTKLTHATGAWSEILDLFDDCKQEVRTSQSYRLLSTLGKNMSDAIRMKCQ